MDKRNLRKERIGVVTSNKMQKSIVVSEVGKVKHPMYGKFVLLPFCKQLFCLKLQLLLHGYAQYQV